MIDFQTYGKLWTGAHLTPPSVTLIRRISSGERIPNWTVFTFFTGAFESLVLMADILPPTEDPLSEIYQLLGGSGWKSGNITLELEELWCRFHHIIRARPSSTPFCNTLRGSAVGPRRLVWKSILQVLVAPRDLTLANCCQPPYKRLPSLSDPGRGITIRQKLLAIRSVSSVQLGFVWHRER